jgi:hypothetical protein
MNIQLMCWTHDFEKIYLGFQFQIYLKNLFQCLRKFLPSNIRERQRLIKTDYYY